MVRIMNSLLLAFVALIALWGFSTAAQFNSYTNATSPANDDTALIWDQSETNSSASVKQLPLDDLATYVIGRIGNQTVPVFPWAFQNSTARVQSNSTGEVVYDTDENKPYYFNSTDWVAL